jgi:hypothetical protein
MDLTTLAEVKEYLRTAGTPIGTDFDTLIEDTIIPSVSQMIEKFCSRSFGEGVFIEYHDGGGNFVFVKNPPIVSISSIYQDEDWEWDDSHLITSNLYQNFTNSIGYKSGKWPYAVRSIKLTYTGGYVYTVSAGHTVLPNDVKYAATMQSAYSFKRRKDVGLQTVSFPDGNIQKFDSGPLLAEVKGYLSPYDLTEIVS